MKNKKQMHRKILLIIFILIFIMEGNPVFAAHDTVTVSEDTDIYFSGNGETIVMESGSELAGFVVYTDYMTLDLEDGSSVVLISATRKIMTVDPVIAEVVCYGALNYSDITLTSTTTQTITLTFGDSCPAIPSSGGSSGGGGAYVIPVVPITPIIPTTSTNAKPEDYGLKEGDSIRAEGDFDIFIINQYGYKRLFLNPTIFNMYGHLGSWEDVKTVAPETRDAFITSTHYRFVDEDKVYHMNVTGEDTGTLHWLNMTGENFLVQGGKSEAIFIINKSEFEWYEKGEEKNSLN
ncbi:MAG TPA: hypothetical protein VMW82_02020 [Candidatus Paceibacterota bacterium]|nr:hypothetical protein [Candidatus Paceibacterota bacterium]